MPASISLRETLEDDLPIFFRFQLDPEANRMAAFTAKDPANWEAFLAHWRKNLGGATSLHRTILCDGQVVGSIASWIDDGQPEVTYWIGREHWGKGVATRALSEFLANVNRARPMRARVAKDNHGSRRVLERCGFVVVGEDKGFANARGREIEELLLALPAEEKDEVK